MNPLSALPLARPSTRTTWRIHRAAIGVVIILFAAVLVAACGTSSSTNPEAETPATATELATTVPEQPAVTPTAAAPAAAPASAEDADDDIPASSGPAAALEPAQRNSMYSAPPPMTIDPAKYYYATIRTEKGDIEVQLFADRAPNTVNNFVFLAHEGYYDNTTFHRVLDGFMAQAGDPTGTGAGGPGYEFADEIVPGLSFDQSGLLAMANRGPGTNGSQFFITFAPTDWLDGKHTIFGKVIKGEEILGQLTRRNPDQNPAGEGDRILTISVEESGVSILPTPTPSPPTPTPTMTPTPFAPSSMDSSRRPLATVTPAERVNYFNTAPEMVIDPALHYQAVITTTKGTLIADLFSDKAPLAVNNFVVLAQLGFYDSTPITLVRPDDSIIFGLPDNNPLNDAGYRFAAEIGSDIQTGVGAMTYIPLEQAPDGTILSSSSQILMALIDPPDELNVNLAFFGQVVEGLDVLDQLTTEDTIEQVIITTSE